MTVRGQKDIDGLKKAGFAVAETLEVMKSALQEGITTRELDRIGAENLPRGVAILVDLPVSDDGVAPPSASPTT